jgi:hypothetical protein
MEEEKEVNMEILFIVIVIAIGWWIEEGRWIVSDWIDDIKERFKNVDN